MEMEIYYSLLLLIMSIAVLRILFKENGEEGLILPSIVFILTGTILISETMNSCFNSVTLLISLLLLLFIFRKIIKEDISDNTSY